MTKKTISLNTAINCEKKDNGVYDYVNSQKVIITAPTINYIYSFDIPAIEVSSGAKLRIVNFCHDSSSSFIMIKIKDILYNSNYYYVNDGTFPTLIAYNFSNNAPNCYLNTELTLNKQSINFINLQVSNSISDINAGIPVAANFIITLEIEEE